MQECNCHKYTQFSDAVHLERTKEALRPRSHLGASGTERLVSAASLYCNALEQVCVRGDQIDGLHKSLPKRCVCHYACQVLTAKIGQEPAVHTSL
jgi:hypothetical protein